MGLPGSGKTTLAKVLALKLNAVMFNADEVRENINKDLGFAMEDRLEQAKRMGWLCDQIVKVGNFVIADFVCPTKEARQVFCKNGEAFIIWVNRIKESRFSDTNKIFIIPDKFDFEVINEGSAEEWAQKIYEKIISKN